MRTQSCTSAFSRTSIGEPKNSEPHDHGPSWAVYSQVAGVTEMTDWRMVQKPADGRPGKVEKVRTFKLTPGTAHLYNEGDSCTRRGATAKRA